MDWFKMLSRYPGDPAILAVGDYGELLFGRACAYAAHGDTDGFIPNRQIDRFGIRDARILASALVVEKLWIVVAGGWQITNWTVIQSEAYMAEHKRRRDRNRQRSLRAVARQSRDESPDVAALEVEEETNPLTPSPEGGSCNGQHDNCRTCGTTRRQQAKAQRLAKPAWCGGCEETTRLLGWDSDTPSRCPQCHPALHADSGSGIVQQDVG